MFIEVRDTNKYSYSSRHPSQDYVSPDSLRQVKAQKKLVLTGASRFNAKPKTGIAFLEENKLIYSDPNEPRAHSLAAFLKNCTSLDKRLLGDYISKPDNIDLLKAFVGLFDFNKVRILKWLPSPNHINHVSPQKSVADAMRELLETFRLPGESQQINRITETFAEAYFASDPGTTRPRLAMGSILTLHSGGQVSRCCLRSGLLNYHAQHGSSQPSNSGMLALLCSTSARLFI